jgi:uncharacterized protein (DUF1778 family)
MAGPLRTRDKRLEIRTTAERELIDRATDVEGTDLTAFVITHLTDPARQVLVDRDRFALPPAAKAEWDKPTADRQESSLVSVASVLRPSFCCARRRCSARGR